MTTTTTTTTKQNILIYCRLRRKLCRKFIILQYKNNLEAGLHDAECVQRCDARAVAYAAQFVGVVGRVFGGGQLAEYDKECVLGYD